MRSIREAVQKVGVDERGGDRRRLIERYRLGGLPVGRRLYRRTVAVVVVGVLVRCRRRPIIDRVGCMHRGVSAVPATVTFLVGRV
ncbi:MAG TPA: hypothetical protein VM533_09540, partial [Fimbriiglobus sp.]|nr:hypothetical protein [Fimbriiglobus sp.]